MHFNITLVINLKNYHMRLDLTYNIQEIVINNIPKALYVFAL